MAHFGNDGEKVVAEAAAWREKSSGIDRGEGEGGGGWYTEREARTRMGRGMAEQFPFRTRIAIDRAIFETTPIIRATVTIISCFYENW